MELRDGVLDDHGVRVLLKRDDLIHPEVPGNKWRKLKYNLAEAKARVMLVFSPSVVRTRIMCGRRQLPATSSGSTLLG
ncbi:hypothetical protein [Saccharomonospora sp. CUA-673]|uniref:hypothetical protein n=1 Tax=Saccharomonospora sp. CUA-673 TaxID=1904969 RepID=UPI000A5BC837|nr:hypothetical protein [Saccharomonospora sp. CUA-673]